MSIAAHQAQHVSQRKISGRSLTGSNILVPRVTPRALAARLPSAQGTSKERFVSPFIARSTKDQGEPASSPQGQADSDSDVWVPVCLPEELPKGTRKEVEVDGRQVLLFWYRNQIYAIEGRAPSEGAYSEGFISAKFTQDFCIECPATGTLFSLKDGSIQSWYPKNPVLRALTPQDTCRKMEIYPVKLTQQAICVDITKSSATAKRADRGGAGTSLENNNVFTVQPNVYFEGMNPVEEQASVFQDGPKEFNPAILATTFVGAVSFVGVSIAVFLYVTGK